MPVYLDKKRGTYYFSGTFINVFGENEKYFVRGFSSPTAAKKAEREYLIKARTNPNTKYRFSDLIIKFLDYKKERVKPRTISNYTNLINKQLLVNPSQYCVISANHSGRLFCPPPIWSSKC